MAAKLIEVRQVSPSPLCYAPVVILRCLIEVCDVLIRFQSILHVALQVIGGTVPSLRSSVSIRINAKTATGFPIHHSSKIAGIGPRKLTHRPSNRTRRNLIVLQVIINSVLAILVVAQILALLGNYVANRLSLQ